MWDGDGGGVMGCKQLEEREEADTLEDMGLAWSGLDGGWTGGQGQGREQGRKEGAQLITTTFC